jgi:parallel beta-helix repeat protein
VVWRYVENINRYIPLFVKDKVSIPAVDVQSEYCKFDSNNIVGNDGDAIIAHDGAFINNIIYGSVSVTSNAIFQKNVFSGAIWGGTTFQNNRVNGSIHISGASTVQGNYIESGGIYCNDYAVTIEDNTIKGGGIFGAAGVIQHNLITGAYYGISTGTAPVTIQANTITQNNVGIYVGSTAPTIIGNNIEGNTQNSIALTTGDDVDATGNWWGTSDTQAISRSIHDFKNDFNLGTVNYEPILTAPNSQTGPKQNPDLPSATPFPATQVTNAPPRESGASDTFWGLMLHGATILVVLLVAVAVVLVVVFIAVTRWNKKSAS